MKVMISRIFSCTISGLALVMLGWSASAVAGTGADSAGDSEYVSNSWNDGQNAGSGFGAWKLVGEASGGGFAGFFAADDPNGVRGIDNVGAEQVPPLPYTTPATDGFVWSSFANKGDGIDRATAYRALNESLDGSGDTFQVSYEHGFLNGAAGVALRAGPVDPNAAAADFTIGARTQFYFTGGSAGYTIEDDAGLVQLDGLTPGLPLVPFTFFGVDLEYTLSGADTYDIKITKYNSEAGSGGAAPDVFDKNTHSGLGGRTLAGAGTIDSLALFQSDVEKQSDGFFNNLAYSGSGAGGGTGSDDASDSDYDFGWDFGTNGGSGFGIWEMASETVGGFAGQFIQSGAGNGVDNIGSPAPDGAVWASFANQGDFADKSSQFRDFDNPLSASGDTFSVSLENGFVDPGGKVGISLRDRAVNSFSETPDDFADEALFQFYFEGGDGNYTVVDSSGEVDTGVTFSFFGIDLDLTLTSATTFDLDITRYDTANDPAPVVTSLTGLTFASTPGNGSIESLAFFNVDAPTQSDVYFNLLSYENVEGIPGDFNGDDIVDGLDFLAWQRGDSPDPLSQTDLDLWAANYGNSASTVSTVQIPEPVSLTLLGSGLVALLWHRRRS